jgi:flagellar biogenesis protein FliO
MKVLRQLSPGTRKHAAPRLQVLDRLSLGGKKSLLLISVRGQHLLVGVGDAAAPSITRLDPPRLLHRASGRIGGIRGLRARKVMGS